MKTYTVKEAAGILGISKQGLRYWLDRLGIPLEKGNSGRYAISEETLHRVQRAREATSEVTSEAVSEPTSGSGKIVDNKGNPESEAVSEVTSEPTSAEAVALEVLREQIEKKDAEIERLNKKIDEKEHRIDELTDRLNEALAKAQTLHAVDKLLPEGKDEEGTTVADEPEGVEVPPDRKRRSFWEWLTGK